jgi:hypothetical protein
LKTFLCFRHNWPPEEARPESKKRTQKVLTLPEGLGLTEAGNELSDKPGDRNNYTRKNADVRLLCGHAEG